MRSVCSALLYFGVYIAWQVITAFAATVTISASLMISSGVPDMEKISTDASIWVLEHSVHLTIVSGLLTLATYWLIFIIRKKNPLKEVGLAKIRTFPCFGLVLLGVALNLAVAFILPFFPFPEEWWESQTVQTELLLGAERWATVVLTVLVAPILEEVVFRGLVHTRLKKGMPMLAAMIISSWLFGVMHGTMIAFVYAAILGFLLSWVFEKYNSLVAPILVHFGFNLCAIALEGLEAMPSFVCLASFVISVFGIIYIQKTAKGKIEIYISTTQDQDGKPAGEE